MKRYAIYGVKEGYVVELRNSMIPPAVENGQAYKEITEADYVKVGIHAIVNNTIVVKPNIMAEMLTEADILAEVDSIRIQRQMAGLTRGTSVSLEYEQIGKEFADYSKLLPNIIGTLGLTDRQTRWPTAMTEVSLTGSTLEAVMASYGKAIKASTRPSRITGRIAVDAKQRIKKAEGIENKRKEFLKTNWLWQPNF